MNTCVEQLALWQMPLPGAELIGQRVRYSKGYATISGIAAWTERWGTLYTLHVDGYDYTGMLDHIAYDHEFEVIGVKV